MNTTRQLTVQPVSDKAKAQTIHTMTAYTDALMEGRHNMPPATNADSDNAAQVLTAIAQNDVQDIVSASKMEFSRYPHTVCMALGYMASHDMLQVRS